MACNCGGGGGPALPSTMSYRPKNPARLPLPDEVSFTFSIPRVTGSTSYVGPSGKRYIVTNGQTWLIKTVDAQYFAKLGFGGIVGRDGGVIGEVIETASAPAAGEFEALNPLEATA